LKRMRQKSEISTTEKRDVQGRPGYTLEAAIRGEGFE